jgi:hypothetical protein
MGPGLMRLGSLVGKFAASLSVEDSGAAGDSAEGNPAGMEPVVGGELDAITLPMLLGEGSSYLKHPFGVAGESGICRIRPNSESNQVFCSSNRGQHGHSPQSEFQHCLLIG